MVNLRKKYYGDPNLSNAKRPFKYQLDYFNNGKRVREVIKEIIVIPTDNRDIKKQKERIAQNIRSKLEIELGSRKVGLTSRQLQKANFIDYFQMQGEKKGVSTKVAWRNTYKHIINFHGKKLKFEDVSVAWLERFKDYLDSQISNNSVLTYMLKINTALNQAVKEKIILENPYKYIDKPKKEEKEMVYLVKEEIQELINTEFYDN
ncbi:MAG: phage integrase SAM-like domain-containing protein, partial [Flavobacteriales bacterium]|nr:phage integrase SAM-like domain-containing protein [Flavobacteriales bacterium]